jgi:hypothetical protein
MVYEKLKRLASECVKMRENGTWIVLKCEGTALGCLKMRRNWLRLFGNVK